MNRLAPSPAPEPQAHGADRRDRKRNPAAAVARHAGRARSPRQLDLFRYLLPIVPFLIGYFLVGVHSIAARVRDAGPPAFRIASGCLLFFILIEHGQYIWMKGQEAAPVWIRDGREVRAVTDFVNQRVPAGATAASTNPGLVYLATGRKAVVYIDPDERWAQWQAAGIRYVVALHAVPQPSPALGYSVVFESPRLRLWVSRWLRPNPDTQCQHA